MRTWWIIALWALCGCSVTHDFDQPFPERDVDDDCALLCDDTAACVRDLTNRAGLACNFGEAQADLALFKGHCDHACRANPNLFDRECSNERDNFRMLLENNVRAGFASLCEAGESLCDTACRVDVDNASTFLNQWTGDPLHNDEATCRRDCDQAEEARWRCVGERIARLGGDLGDHAPNCGD